MTSIISPAFDGLDYHNIQPMSSNVLLSYASQLEKYLPQFEKLSPQHPPIPRSFEDFDVSPWFPETKHQWRLCVKAKNLGTFYLFADPKARVASLLPNIELKIYELYNGIVNVHCVTNSSGINLPISSKIGNVLGNHSLVCVDFDCADDSLYVEELRSEEDFFFEEELSSDIGEEPIVEFGECPPTKVIQNREFSFSVSVKGPNGTFYLDDQNEQFYESGSVDFDNDWGVPVPVPATSGNETWGRVPFDVIVEEESGAPLAAKDFSVRGSILDKNSGLFVFLVKIKKNSHYGRTRFVIKIKKKKPANERRNNRDSFDLADNLLCQMENNFLVVSAPIGFFKFFLFYL